MPWRRKWQPTPVFLPGKSSGPWSLVGYRPWGRKELDTTERVQFHFSLFTFNTPWRRKWEPTSVFLPGKSHGPWSLVGYRPWVCIESDTTEQFHFHFSCTGEGNGNPLQCSCLEDPRDGGAWWTAIYGVAHSRTRLKRLSSRAKKSGV